MSDSRPLRFAAFGTGYWSTFQIPAWLELGGVELVALYNRTVSKAEAAAALYGHPRVYGDPEELLRNEQLDFIDIITEVPAHAPLVLLAAKHKVPVICQKPIAYDYATAKTMVDACREAGIPFYIHENFRWQVPMRAVKQALSENLIGEIVRANLQVTNEGPGAYDSQPFLKTVEHAGLTDMGAHVFDLARSFFGEPERVYCDTYRTRVDGERVEDIFVALLRIGETLCTCESTFHCITQVFIEGTAGSIELDLDNLLHIRTDAGEEVRDTRTWPRHAWSSEGDDGPAMHSIYLCNQNLLGALTGQGEAETTAKNNLQTVQVMDAAIQSSVTRQAVALPYSE